MRRLAAFPSSVDRWCLLGVYGMNPLISYEMYGNQTVQSYVPNLQEKIVEGYA